MAITISHELETFAQEQARQRGLRDASEYVSKLLHEQQQRVREEAIRAEHPGVMTRGERAIARMRQARTNGLTADQIMEMTRSEA